MMSDENGKDLLFALAKEQDRHEEDYSRDIITRIGLFLVFAGFISAIATTFLTQILSGETSRLWGWTCGTVFLGVTFLALFVSIVLLLWAALKAGYETPAAVGKYRRHYEDLVQHNEGDIKKAGDDLLGDLLDAYEEAVDQNIEKNTARMKLVIWAHRIMIFSVSTLILAIAFLAIPRIVQLELNRGRIEKAIGAPECKSDAGKVAYEEEKGKEESKEESCKEATPQETEE